MGIASKRKGKAGERELINLLKDYLGEDLRRNLDQVRGGGADVLGLPGWAVEVKRAKTPRLHEWWFQAIAQAQANGERPVLAYRLDRKPWRFLVALRDIVPGFEQQPDTLEWTAELDFDGFCAVVREKWPAAPESEQDVCDWWEQELMSDEKQGEADAEKGVFSPPYPIADDPSEEQENFAYRRGFDRQRKRLGEQFKWA